MHGEYAISCMLGEEKLGRFCLGIRYENSIPITSLMFGTIIKTKMRGCALYHSPHAEVSFALRPYQSRSFIDLTNINFFLGQPYR